MGQSLQWGKLLQLWGIVQSTDSFFSGLQTTLHQVSQVEGWAHQVKNLVAECKTSLIQEIRAIDMKIFGDKQNQIRLVSIKDQLEAEIEELRIQLNESREKKYNL